MVRGVTGHQKQGRDQYWATFGAWIRQRLAEMQPDRWTQLRLRDELADIGIAVKREWVNQVINGKQPSDDLRKGIERLLGPFPEPEPTHAIGQPDLIAALRAQTAAITALVEELQLSRVSQATIAEETMKALAAVAAGRAPRETPGAAEPAASAGTAR
jgi:hypothetical protein